MSEVLALGLSHNTAPLALRERASMTEGRAAGAMRELTASTAIDEAVVVSTCNRTEIFLATADPVEAESLALGAIAGKAQLQPTELAPRLYVYRGERAVRHLFRVSAGLDSVVLGEAEIQGQVRRAYELALVEGATGPILNRLFQAALRAGGRVRSETAIGVGKASLSSVAVEMAEQTLGDLSGTRVMLVGAGETARLVARALDGHGARTAYVANRHHDRAKQLATEHGGEALSLEEMLPRLGQADLIISATHSPHHVLEPEALADTAGERLAKRVPPLLIIDLAVPRDIHPDCRDLGGITIFDIDDLQALAEQNAQTRAKDGEAALAIVNQEVERFQQWWETLRVLPTIAAMKQRADRIVRRVLAENEPAWSDMSRVDRRRMQAMAEAVATRLLDEPIRRLKNSDESVAESHAAVLQELFHLEPVGTPATAESAEVDGGHPGVADLTERRRLKRRTA